MKKIFAILIAILFSILLIGCGHEVYTNNNGLMHVEDGTHTFDEWVSPDGVHYWLFDQAYGSGLAPRYDCNGNLVIDD